MISKNHGEALNVLVKKLKGKGVNWVLIGSTNLAVQGVDVKENDIDILTDKQGALRIGKLLKDFVIQQVAYSKSERFSSYHGKFSIHGVEVDVMGELVNTLPSGDLWSETKAFSEKRIIALAGMHLPVISLEKEFHAYTKLGRIEKARKIKEFLDRQNQ